ncbi:MAG TPA: glycosyltransferase [Candidatus Baltobacteraceae bacterium]|nr:glycosyltransferase [Candidatus Baltobacteraceae bacterium]
MAFQRSRSIICFSHLRWSFVFQRPQHILSRLAAEYDIHFFEEPVFEDGAIPELVKESPAAGVTVVRPRLPRTEPERAEIEQEHLLRSYIAQERLRSPILWYYTPMAMGFTQRVTHSLCVYDCMDELSMFAFAPAILKERERMLFDRADVVFTGGRSLFYNKRRHHENVRCFPSAVDAQHFAPRAVPEPAELRSLPHPRFGFYGVVDERFDAEYLRRIASARPQWQFVVVGPVVKIDPQTLPQAPNIHYVPQRGYDELPAYLHHWDVAMLPFALNDSTRFISPTKTLEYLAAEKPVISTPIADVVDPYGEEGLVGIAGTPEEFVSLGDRILREGVSDRWRSRIRATVKEQSWDATVAAMGAELNRLALAQVVAR